MDRRSFLTGVAAAGAGAMLAAQGGTASAQPRHAEQRSGAPSSPSRPVIGYVLSSEQFPISQLVSFARAAEDAGFDAAWISDHFQPWQDNEGHSSQAWVALSAMGQATNRIMLGTGVTCPTYRYRPQIVAEAFATLANLYPGRIFLGTGTGEALNEIPGGGGFGAYRERADRWVEAVQLIRQLWTGETISSQGPYYPVQKAKLYDAPSTPIPLYMAASGPKSGRLSGMHGDGLITEPKMAQSQEMRDAWSSGAAAAGNNASALQLITEQFVVVGDESAARRAAEIWRFQPKAWHPYVLDPDPESIHRRADAEVPLEEVYKDWPVSTDPSVHARAIQKLLDAGVTQVFVHSAEPDQLSVIEFFGSSVLPLLRTR